MLKELNELARSGVDGLRNVVNTYYQLILLIAIVLVILSFGYEVLDITEAAFQLLVDLINLVRNAI